MKKSITDATLNPMIPYEDQVNIYESMAKCEEFAKTGKNEKTGGVLGYDPNSRHCLCCTMSLVCMKLGYTLNVEHSIRRVKSTLGINNFYSEYKRSKLDELEREYIAKIKYLVNGIDVESLKQELISLFREDLNAEVDVFTLDFLERLKSNEQLKVISVKDNDPNTLPKSFIVQG